MGHTHEIADQVAPGRTRVVYVDSEPVAVAHSTSLLREHGDETRHVAIHADLRDPRRIWERVAETGVLDLDQPVALLIVAVLHFEQPPAPGSGRTGDLGPSLAAEYRELLAPGSYLALSQVTDEGVPPHYHRMLADLRAGYTAAGTGVVYRSRAEIRALFGDFTMLDPGVTWTPCWHPEEAGADDDTVRTAAANESLVLAGAARKDG
jgi:hypothetical protein